MGKVVYTLSTFDHVRAAAGEMCVMVPSNMAITSGTTTINYYTEYEFGGGEDAPNENFLGLGICREIRSNRFNFVVDSVPYVFDNTGAASSLKASGKKLVMGTLYSDANNKTSLPVDVGDATTTAGVRIITRSEDGATASVETRYNSNETSAVTVSDLTARDQFANLAMRGMLEHIPDPSSLSNNEISMYCQAAYKWASNMMREAANARVTGVSENDHSSSEVPVASLEGNTEKLLNNISEGILGKEIPAHWSKAGQSDVVGPYTDAFAATLPNSGTAYTGITAAENDGWSWTACNSSVTVSNAVNDSFSVNGTLNVKNPVGQALTVRGESTYHQGQEDEQTGVLKVNVIAGGGGGGGSTDLSSIANTLKETTGVSNTLYTQLAYLATEFGFLGYGNGVGDSQKDVLNSIKDAITNSGKLKRTDIDVLTHDYDADYISDILVYASGYNTIVPYRTSPEILAKTMRLPVVNPSTSGAFSVSTLTAAFDKYYNFALVSNLAGFGSLTIALPSVSNTTKESHFKVFFLTDTSASAFALTIQNAGDYSVIKGGNTITRDSSYYELDCVFNGKYWLIEVTKFSTTTSINVGGVQQVTI